MKKRVFRKIFIICHDNKIIDPYEVCDFFKRREYAKNVQKHRQEKANDESRMMYWPKNMPATQHTVHGFYLVHESLFDEILKPFSKVDSEDNTSSSNDQAK